jgi:hypothetical protein
MRNLRNEASAIAPGALIKLRENRAACKAGTWGAWDVLAKQPGQSRGRVVATLIHRAGTRFV